LVGRIGWFQERWILRNLQRSRGAACDPAAIRLAPLRPQADLWWQAEPAQSLQTPCPLDLQDLRADLLQILEATLELLAGTAHRDETLYFYRLALHHEDARAEQLVQILQAQGLPIDRRWRERWSAPALAAREPLWLPASRAELGSSGPGFAFDNEQPAHRFNVPEFEIDAQPVCWAQYLEFVDDGGYDRQELWAHGGWEWLQAMAQGEGRRAPRHVEQIGLASGAVMQTRFGQPTRMAAQQPVTHVSWWEADAWCRWAGRRLPLEPEWEIAASAASTRGFRWGDVWEWTASRFAPYEGFVSGPDASHSLDSFGRTRVLRGGSRVSAARLKSPRFRHFAAPERDDLFCGFRSCAV
jgi:ergothioneine biosynthesis protein EgtB